MTVPANWTRIGVLRNQRGQITAYAYRDERQLVKLVPAPVVQL